MDTTDEEGVLPLSPAESSLGSSSASVLPPRSRARPLVSGSKKESWLIGRLDDMKLHVERFHARRRGVPPISSGGDIGYGTFDEAAADMTQIFNLVWMSSTRECSPASIVEGADCKQHGCRSRIAYRSRRWFQSSSPRLSRRLVRRFRYLIGSMSPLHL